MIVSVRIDYFEPKGSWTWEITVDGRTEFGVERDFDNAFAAAQFELDGMLENDR